MSQTKAFKKNNKSQKIPSNTPNTQHRPWWTTPNGTNWPRMRADGPVQCLSFQVGLVTVFSRQKLLFCHVVPSDVENVCNCLWLKSGRLGINSPPLWKHKHQMVNDAWCKMHESYFSINSCDFISCWDFHWLLVSSSISWLGGPERRRGHPSPAARDQVRYSTAGHHRTGRDSEKHREAKDSEKVMYKSLIEGRERVELENFD